MLQNFRPLPHSTPFPSPPRQCDCVRGVSLAPSRCFPSALISAPLLCRTVEIVAVIGLIPDLLIAWAIAAYTDSGPIGFLFALAAIVLIYIVIWLKNTAWGWMLYWLSGRRQLINRIEDFLITNHFPRPPEFIGGAKDYLRQIAENEESDGRQRAQAAFELGTIQGFRSAEKVQHLLRLLMAFEEASSDTAAAFRARQVKTTNRKPSDRQKMK
jgi:hypothetical protein